MLDRRSWLQSFLGTVLPVTKVQAVQIEDKRKPIFILTLGEQYVDPTDLEVARVQAKWTESFLGDPPGQLVIIPPGSRMEVVPGERGCSVRETLGHSSYEVHGRTPEDVQALVELMKKELTGKDEPESSFQRRET